MSKENNTPLEKLFGSKTRTKLLSLFFGNPERSFYVREMTRVIEEQINSVRRELLNLEGIGIIKNETYDNKVYYSANNKHPYARPLTMLFSTRTDVVVDVAVKPNVWEEYVRSIKNYLDCLIVTNRLPGQEGVDLLIVGDDKTKKLTHWAEVVEKKEGKPLNYVIMSRDDFQYRLNVKDRFVSEVLEMSILEKIDPDGILSKR
ncbi:MAG: transcriptional regulator [Candidatus Nanosyncoccus sp.]